MLADIGFKANKCNLGLQMKSKGEEQRKKKDKNEKRDKRSKEAREKEKQRKRERNSWIFVSIPTTQFSIIKHDSQISMSTVKHESR